MCLLVTLFFWVGVVLLPKLLSLPSSSLVHVGAPASAAFGVPAAPVAAFGTAPVPAFGNEPAAVRFNAAGLRVSF